MNLVCTSITNLIGTTWQAKILSVLATVVSFTMVKPIVGLIWGLLIVLDTITGMLQAKCLGQTITSKTMWYKLNLKIWSYLIPLIILALMGLLTYHCFGPGIAITFLYLQTFILWLQCSREAISIIENLQTCGYEFPFSEKVIKLLRKSEKQIGNQIDILCEDEHVTSDAPGTNNQ
jgi:phage-related holin